MNPLNVNYLGILVAGCVAMLIGYVWYSPILFGKQWMVLLNLSAKKLSSMAIKPLPAMLLSFVAALGQATVLSMILNYFTAVNFYDGMFVGALVWLGFTTVAQFNSTIFSGRNPKIYLIETVYSLLTLMLMGGILAVWA